VVKKGGFMLAFVTRRILLTTSLTFACAMATSAASAGQDAAQIKKGQAVYTAQKCQVCHAIAGKGGKASALDGVGGKLSADDIRQWITHPTDMTAKAKSTKKPAMPNKYGSLAAADLAALVAYLASLK
jgi:mono/diheme cytochrome c family protein